MQVTLYAQPRNFSPQEVCINVYIDSSLVQIINEWVYYQASQLISKLNANHSYNRPSSYANPFTMRVIAALAFTGAFFRVAHAAPAAGPIGNKADSSLRLIQTSEADAGTWISEGDFFDQFISKDIGFVDITDSVQV